MPPTLKTVNDKKMRRFYEKCATMIEHFPYLRIAMRRQEFKKEFKKGAAIDLNFISMLGQWTALVSYLWSISDSTKQGFNSTLVRNLMVSLTALLEDTDDNTPNENILIR